MMLCGRGLRLALVSLMVIAMLAPRVSALVVDILPGMQKMVICTGDALVVWTIGPDGTPIEAVEVVEHPCLIGEDAVFAAAASARWMALAQDYQNRFAIVESPAGCPDHPVAVGPVRGPPVVV
ncbi:hypothetical protein [Yoonia sp. SS1-5]|uniref:Uncharacterized protein n=1 Tax=Yoonia rhodophyticola TaxID=3137370 RepID=A0AAN0MDZ3_9RHOB